MKIKITRKKNGRLVPRLATLSSYTYGIHTHTSLLPKHLPTPFASSAIGAIAAWFERRPDEQAIQHPSDDYERYGDSASYHVKSSFTDLLPFFINKRDVFLSIQSMKLITRNKEK